MHWYYEHCYYNKSSVQIMNTSAVLKVSPEQDSVVHNNNVMHCVLTWNIKKSVL
jgi:hypothetical protein